MPRSRLIFLLIIGVAILFVVVVLSLQKLPPPPTATPRPTLQVEISVNPLAYAWINEQATAFNAQQNQVEGQSFQILVTQQDSIDVWQTGSLWTAAKHPVAWVPESAFVFDYAAETGLRYDVVSPSLVSTSLIWGVFADRADALKRVGQTIDWESLQKAVDAGTWSSLGGQNNWGAVKAAFARPSKSTAGYAVLLAAAAAYAQTDQLTAQTMNDPSFQLWFSSMIDAVPNFASLGQQPVSALASRGSSIADFALAPESDWLLYYSTISGRQPLRFAYPAYEVTFEMPLAIWSGSETTSAERGAVQQFANFLQQTPAQQQAALRGLRPTKLDLSSVTGSPFAAASSAGITLTPPAGKSVKAPPRTAALSTLRWFDTVRRAP